MLRRKIAGVGRFSVIDIDYKCAFREAGTQGYFGCRIPAALSRG